ncbi:hypothetical protein A2704_06845 [Candidatus Kaiserbacteria bacterium RIFCSPHIGHO2_01_FULL_54_36b]|uniref:Uncharacterized protein n=1 Tax=Candidatus Kaiserbacteria bacterium RIFCSPHIGHO2_01_FULL_54_36b TaxID=1798483 RepID=A0A1F6CNE1_9BACT|nr:MAG: hypothetical protein A2704_06845 [Candidatus Kaiserbacteria bacterium RIFCSPHIGHO2_01_FULL_54_36b]
MNPFFVSENLTPVRFFNLNPITRVGGHMTAREILKEGTTAGKLMEKLLAEGRHPMDWEEKSKILSAGSADKEKTNVFLLVAEDGTWILLAVNYSAKDKLWFAQSFQGRDGAIIPKGSIVYSKEE